MKKQNNKGFTLVELIVVMAIMAILVGALAPQVVKYVNKARESKDLQVVSTVYTAVQATIGSSSTPVSSINGTLEDATTDVAGYVDMSGILPEVKSLLASDMQTSTDIKNKCKSADGLASTGVYVVYDSNSGYLAVYFGTAGATASSFAALATDTTPTAAEAAATIPAASVKIGPVSNQ